MPFVTRQQINPDVLEQNIRQHRERLRQLLLDTSLTAGQRSQIKEQIHALGLSKGRKVYSSDSPPKPGAIKIGD